MHYLLLCYHQGGVNKFGAGLGRVDFFLSCFSALGVLTVSKNFRPAPPWRAGVGMV